MQQNLVKCPLLQKRCVEERCSWWVLVSRENIQTGERDIKGMCQVNNLAFLAVEIMKNVSGAQAAVESLRNMITGVPRASRILEVSAGDGVADSSQKSLHAATES
jgi:hypothetical protein